MKDKVMIKSFFGEWIEFNRDEAEIYMLETVKGYLKNFNNLDLCLKKIDNYYLKPLTVRELLSDNEEFKLIVNCYEVGRKVKEEAMAIMGLDNK